MTSYESKAVTGYRRGLAYGAIPRKMFRCYHSPNFGRRGHTMTQRLTAEEFETFRKDLPTSLGYYQATVTMISIFLGFSFAALLQILTRRNPQTYSVLVTFLV